MIAMDASNTQTATPLTPTSREVKEIVDIIVETIHPLRVLVFGSVARGTTGPDSDVDLLVVVPNGSHRRKTGQEIDMALLHAMCDTPADIVVATEQDIADYGENSYLVLKNALEDGREVYRVG